MEIFNEQIIKDRSVDTDSSQGLIPSTWIGTKLGEIAVWGSGGTPNSTVQQYYDGDIPWLVIGDLNDGYIYESKKRISEAGLENSSAKIVAPNNVLVAMYGSIGKVGINKIPVATNQAIAFTQELSPHVLNKYLFYYLLHIRDQLQSLGKGGAQKNISQSLLKEVDILLAPLKEQEHIVSKIDELFSELDKGIEYLKTAQDQLKVYRQSVLKYAFEGKLTEQWREAHIDQLETADQLLESIHQERESLYQQQLNEWEEVVKVWEENGKEGKKLGKPQTPLNISSLTEEELVNLPDLPESWCWIKLSVLSERIQVGPFGSLLHRADYVSNQVPIVNPVHIRNQKIEPDWRLTVTEEKVNELSNYIMYPGDIVMGRRGEMGRCAVISHEESGFLCGSGSLFIRLLPSVNPLFYCYLLGSQRLKNYLSDESVGTTMQNLNQEIIHNLPVPLCSPIEIQEIIEEVARRTTLITEVENTIGENLLASKVLRQSILKRAFSGQLVPQDSSDEHAAVLLERIRESRRHQQENKVSLPKPRKKVAMKKDLSIIEVLQELNGLATAQDVWRRSKHQEHIEDFYAELKKQINNGVIEEVEELREEKKSYLRLRNEN